MDYDWVYSKLFNGTIRWWCLVHLILNLRLFQHLKKKCFYFQRKQNPSVEVEVDR